ncbi:MAG TPA: methyltransferase domain-containing protein [Stellaceae bacterium]|nr:methyltransferase domain-containing protein [Stellaceae bacterium]
MTTERARQYYAEELRFTAAVRSPALVAAFAAVPRERFLGGGPWRIKSPMNLAAYWTSPDADPRHVYHDVLVALDEERGINNGQPSLWARLFDELAVSAGEHMIHLGCGTGYYTAIAAEMIGPTGDITAIEIDPALAERARVALAPWPHVRVRQADGSRIALDPADVIMASAGASHPLDIWLNALKSRGRLMMPMTSNRGGGSMLLATRKDKAEFAAHFVCPVGFIDFAGARDRKIGERLARALAGDGGASVKSLRRDSHSRTGTCWLHGEDWCLSRRPPAGSK